MFDTHAVNRRAVRLKSNLLRLAEVEKDPSIKKHLVKLASLTRLVFEGPTAGEIRAKLRECFEEYFDGEESRPLTKNDLADMTSLPRTLIDPVIERMLQSGEIVSEVRIPDYHQAGDHSVESFCLNLAARKRSSFVSLTDGPTFTPPAPRRTRNKGRRNEISKIVMVPELPQEAFTNA